MVDKISKRRLEELHKKEQELEKIKEKAPADTPEIPKETGEQKQLEGNTDGATAKSLEPSPDFVLEEDADYSEEEAEKIYKQKCGKCGAYFNEFKNVDGRSLCPNEDCKEDWTEALGRAE